MREMVPDIAEAADVGQDDTEVDGRRRWFWILLSLSLATLAGIWIVTAGGGSAPAAVASADLRFAEVVRADLVEESTFDATLGRTEGDPITASLAGTVTAAPDPGETVEQGDVLYEIDREPVALLYGDLPIYRTLTSSAEDWVITARSGGTVTWVPETGTELVEGDVMLRIDDQPIILLYGESPAYRTMADQRIDIEGTDVLQLEEALQRIVPDTSITIDGTFSSATADAVEDLQEMVGADATGRLALGSVVFLPGPTEVTAVDVIVGEFVNGGRSLLSLAGDELMEGDDVLQLEQALVDLGYGNDSSLDGVFDAATTAAVMEFQSAVGMEPDGRIDLGDVVVRPGAVRVIERLTSVGGRVSAGGAILSVSASEIVITLDLPAVDQDLIGPGDVVTVELPDGSVAPATVESVSSVASAGQGGATTFEATVLLDDPSVAGDLDEAPVEVRVVSDSVADVMAVPVTSLLALREGGYAVEVALADGTTALVGVEPGFFADGLVEVNSAQLQIGARVVVP